MKRKNRTAEKDPRIVLQVGKEVVIIVAQKDGIRLENNAGLNLRVIKLGSNSQPLPKKPTLGRKKFPRRIQQVEAPASADEEAQKLLHNCGMLFMLSANLNGAEQQRLIKHAWEKRIPTFIAHSPEDFKKIFANNFKLASNRAAILRLRFRPAKAKINGQDGFSQFSPVAQAGRADLGPFLYKLLKPEERKLPSILIVGKYWKEISRRFGSRTNKLRIAADWRRWRKVVLPVTTYQAVYELVLYRMREDKLAGLPVSVTADKLFDSVRPYFKFPKRDLEFKRRVRNSVVVVHEHHTDLRMKAAA